MSQAFNSRAPSACGTRPTRRTRASRPCALDLGVELRLVRAVADHQELRVRRRRADPRNRRRQHVDAVPAAERAGEADDAIARR